MTKRKEILVFATKGEGSNEEARILGLLEGLPYARFAFDRKRKLRAALRLAKEILESRPHLVVMEGSGLAGGLPLLAARICLGTPFVISSGDAIAPFLSRLFPPGWWLFHAYEFALYRLAAGFIGWTPYLAGRALAAGTPRAMHAPGWSELGFPENRETARREIRRALGIPDDALVAGIAGSLAWNSRVGYCYGLELVEAVARASAASFHVVIMGEGDGLARLRERVPANARARVHFTGYLAGEKLARTLLALDYGLLPQSTDAVGAYRYTTKLPEYLAAGIPVIANRIPAAYDLDSGWITRLPGENPWDPRFLASLAAFLTEAKPADASAAAAQAHAAAPLFSKAEQARRARAFVTDLLDAR